MISASAPGSVMLFGEHAVLQGSHAIVAAVDKYITVHVVERNDLNVYIDSVLGQHQTTLSQLQPVAPFEFVLAACAFYAEELQTGLTIVVESEFSSTVGLGSSAAVTVAICAALRTFLKKSHKPIDIFNDAKQVMLSVQKIGSAADVAASVFGGVSLYRKAPFSIEPLDFSLSLSLAYCGYKEKTVNVLRLVEKKFYQQEHILQDHYANIAMCVDRVKQCLSPNHAQMLVEACLSHQASMCKLGLTTAELDQLINDYSSLPGVIAAKISGSGLGDCIIVFGTFDKDSFSAREDNIAIAVSKKGVVLL